MKRKIKIRKNKKKNGVYYLQLCHIGCYDLGLSVKYLWMLFCAYLIYPKAITKFF